MIAAVLRLRLPDAAPATPPPRRRTCLTTLFPTASVHRRLYDLLLSALSLSWLDEDLSELDGLDGAADDGDDGDDGPDDAIDDDEPDGLDGLPDGVDCDMLDPLGGVVCDDVLWRSLHAAISNAETIATDNAEVFITSPFVTNADRRRGTREAHPCRIVTVPRGSAPYHRNDPERPVGSYRRSRTICNIARTAMLDASLFGARPVE